MAPINPEEIARRESQRNYAEGIVRRSQRQIMEDDADYPAYWQSYDANRGQHTIQRLGQNQTTVATSISSGGFQPGQAVDTAYSPSFIAIDNTPYRRRVRSVTTSNPVTTIQLAFLVYIERYDRDEDGLFALPGSVYLKIDSQPIKLIQNNTLLSGRITYARNFVDMLAVAPNRYVISSTDTGGGSTIYYYDNNLITIFNGIDEPIPGGSGETYFVYDSNPVDRYIIRGSDVSNAEFGDQYYWSDVYLTPIQTYRPSSYGEETLSPYENKWIRVEDAASNWSQILNPRQYRVQYDFPNPVLTAQSAVMGLSTEDIIVMGYQPTDGIYTLSDGYVGTFENPLNINTGSQIEVRFTADRYDVLTLRYFRGIPSFRR